MEGGVSSPSSRSPWRQQCHKKLIFFGVGGMFAGSVMMGIANSFGDMDASFGTSGPILLAMAFISLVIGIFWWYWIYKSASNLSSNPDGTQPVVVGYNPSAQVGGNTAKGQPYPAQQQPYPQAGAAYQSGNPQAPTTNFGGYPPAGSAYPPPGSSYAPPPSPYVPPSDAYAPPPPAYAPPPPAYASLHPANKLSSQ